jgi:beta-galactosidase
VDFGASDGITLTIQGPGELVGFGNAAPATEDAFTSPTHTAHCGAALAGIRRTAAEGDITISAHSHRHGDATVVLAGTAVVALNRT